jgi:hypothetical protein
MDINMEKLAEAITDRTDELTKVAMDVIDEEMTKEAEEQEYQNEAIRLIKEASPEELSVYSNQISYGKGIADGEYLAKEAAYEETFEMAKEAAYDEVYEDVMRGIGLVFGEKVAEDIHGGLTAASADPAVQAAISGEVTPEDQEIAGAEAEQEEAMQNTVALVAEEAAKKMVDSAGGVEAVEQNPALLKKIVEKAVAVGQQVAVESQQQPQPQPVPQG